MAFSAGLGLTNACHLRCPHCYRPEAGLDLLTLEEVKQVCDSIPVRSLNLGVGENGLHPDFHAILAYLAQRGITTSLTTNGLSLQLMSDAEVKRFHSVELSLDFPTEQEHDAFRGEGNWRMVMDGAERMTSLGLTVTITAVMMSINYRQLPRLAGVAAAFDANLRVNVYQPSHSDRFTLSYDQFWSAFQRLLGSSRLVATTEPVLAAVLAPALYQRRDVRFPVAFGLTILPGYAPYVAGAGIKVLGFLPGYIQPSEDFNVGLRYFLTLGLAPFAASPRLLSMLILAICLLLFTLRLILKQESLDPYRKGYLMVAAYMLLLPTSFYPWYLVWLLPFLCLYPSWGWLYLSGVISLSYLTYTNDHFDFPLPIRLVEFLPVYLLLLGQAGRHQ